MTKRFMALGRRLSEVEVFPLPVTDAIFLDIAAA
jgi:hypothetical protein